MAVPLPEAWAAEKAWASAWPEPLPQLLPAWARATDTALAAVTARGQLQDRSSCSCLGSWTLLTPALGPLAGTGSG